MVQFVFSRKTIVSLLLAVTIFVPTAWSQPADTTDSRELLKMMRQQTGEPVKPAYDERTERSKTDELLKIIPADSLFVLRVNNFENSLSQIDQFLAGVSPVPMGLRMMVRMQFAKILGSPQLTGVNMNGNFVLFLLPDANSQEEPIPVILVPVTDYQQFISSNANIKQPDEKGISKIVPPQTDGCPDPDMASMQLGNYALISEKPENLLKIANKLSAVKNNGFDTILDAGQIAQAASTPIWACGNMQVVNKIYSSQVTAQMEEIKTSMTRISQGGMDQAAIMNIYFDIIKKLMAETKLITLNINPKPDVLNITNTIIAVPGTEMASALASSSSAPNKAFLGYLKNGAVINSMANTDAPLNKKMSNFGMDVIFALGGEKISQENKAKIKQLTTDLINSLGQTNACSVAVDTKNKPPFTGEYIIEVKDPKKFSSLTDQAVELTRSLGLLDFYKQMGLQVDFSVNRNTDTYNGVSIDSMKLAFKAIDTNSPQAQMTSQMLLKMYGQGFDYRLATVDNLCVCAIGADSNTAIRSLIDKVKAGQAKQPDSEIQNALALIPNADKADSFGTINLLRYAEIIKSMEIIPMPQFEIPQSSSNIVFATKADSGKLTSDFAMPKQHLSEIVATIMVAKQQMQQQQMQSAPMNGELMWTCPTHNRIKMPQPGKCPICGAALVPAAAASAEPNKPAPNAGPQTGKQKFSLDISKPKTDREKRISTIANLQILHSAVLQFKMDTGNYPADLNALVQKPENVDKYPKGGYLDANEVPKDGWENEFVYEVSNDSKGFIITSYGADNQPGGENFATDLSTNPQAMKKKQRTEQRKRP